MKIFLSGTSFAPDYGGPAVSVSRFALELAKQGVNVGLWSPDGSALTSPLVPADGHLTRIAGSVNDALDEFGGADIIHDNGLWRRHNHQLAVAAANRDIPRVVSTRGMLQPWALRHKRPKKKLAWSLYQKRDLADATILHATSVVEASNLKNLDLDRPIRMIANGVQIPEISRATFPEDGAERTAVFLGRIYPVKGLPLLIEAWKAVRPAGWKLVIAGPDEAGHLEEIQAAVKSAALSDVVSFPGPVHGDQKRDILLNASLFVLPTHSESFGMAVAEAMSYGLPVLTTTAAPWSSLETEKAGWRAEPNAESIAQALREATGLDPRSLASMGERGRDIIVRDYRWESIVTEFIAMYEQAMRNGGSPG